MEIRRRPPNPAITVASMEYKIRTADDRPLHILEEIVWHKESEVEQMRSRLPLSELKFLLQSAPPVRDFLAALRQAAHSPAVIAEVKKASPSKGIFREDFDPVAIAQAYERGGATCLSVLTDSKFFQGGFENLVLVRDAVSLPLLCKDFIIYPYQIYLARCRGADAVLLIAAILSDQDLQYFLKIAHRLGLNALIEVHTAAELERALALPDARLIGINNRDLSTFDTRLETTTHLLQTYGPTLSDRQILVVSESGIHTPGDRQTVAQAGATAVLVGESLVKQPNPQTALEQLLGVTATMAPAG